MPITEPRELLLHELGDLLYAEKRLLKALPKQAKQTSVSEMRERLLQHEEETREQIANLEAAFKQMGESPQAERCPGIEGILEEHETFVSEEEPSEEVLDLFLAGSTLRAEHYEIAAYTAAVAQAQALGERKVASLLRENLSQEKAMAKDAQRLGKELSAARA
jgi:ferritin-like metal-binding protein YciE